ncbi:NADH dehydrogenase I chain E [Buchnera aphidicola (Cinara tujafilina)]|uniref:NADH-quinone oxidoreductase subunit E n=1 Tax=Buchnera aphidicola (Cinara tujafilina) TaxID=261317 RepID=F7WZ44_9GAMM|nr:NADH dehydrogenase I chain E [Buchnera aphidicola (Cinara tujafilina)]
MRAVSIEALKIVQKNRKWICTDAILSIATILGISAEEVEGVATFYCHIFRQPVGRNIIKYCDSVVCFINGYLDIEKKLMQLLKIKIGETTQDGRFTLLPTCCLGACDKSPVLLINEDIHHNLTGDCISHLLEKYK